MQDYKLHLVVPHKYITSFPKEYREDICDLSTFIGMVRERQESMPKHFLMWRRKHRNILVSFCHLPFYTFSFLSSYKPFIHRLCTKIEWKSERFSSRFLHLLDYHLHDFWLWFFLKKSVFFIWWIDEKYWPLLSNFMSDIWGSWEVIGGLIQ